MALTESEKSDCIWYQTILSAKFLKYLTPRYKENMVEEKERMAGWWQGLPAGKRRELVKWRNDRREEVAAQEERWEAEQRSKKPAKGGKVQLEIDIAGGRVRYGKGGKASEAYGKTVAEELVKEPVKRRRTETMSVSLLKDLRARVRTHCENLDVPVSQWVAKVVEAAMDSEGGDV